MHRPDRRLVLAEMLDRAVLEAEPAVELISHPDQGHEGQRGFRIAAADVGMDSREPYLLDDLSLRRIALVDPQRMEGGALVVERERMASALDCLRQPVIAERDRPDRPVDREAELLDRDAEGLDRVEQSEEFDFDLFAAVHRLAHLGIGAMPKDEVIEIDQDVADPADDPDRRPAAIADRLLAVFSPGSHRVAL